MIQGALILEGGAMRSVYAAGILDILLENNIEFSYVIGSSAGALVKANYMAKHIGRSIRINVLHSNDSNYFGLKQFIRSKGDIFNFNYLYYTPINDLYPYDMDLLQKTKQQFIITATDCETGLPVYFQKNNYAEMTEALTASCSIPLLSKIVEVDGYKCLDGGVSVPVAVYKAMEDGNKKNIVILTRDLEFRKEESSALLKSTIKLMYRKYPALVQRLLDIPYYYNQLMEEIIGLEKEGKVFVIRPTKPLNIGRTEKDARKLVSAYLMGRDDMRASMPKMLEYLEE